jgi:hypothetical protein
LQGEIRQEDPTGFRGFISPEGFDLGSELSRTHNIQEGLDTPGEEALFGDQNVETFTNERAIVEAEEPSGRLCCDPDIGLPLKNLQANLQVGRDMSLVSIDLVRIDPEPCKLLIEIEACP